MDDAFLRRRSNDAADEGHEEDWNRFEALYGSRRRDRAERLLNAVIRQPISLVIVVVSSWCFLPRLAESRAILLSAQTEAAFSAFSGLESVVIGALSITLGTLISTAVSVLRQRQQELRKSLCDEASLLETIAQQHTKLFRWDKGRLRRSMAILSAYIFEMRRSIVVSKEIGAGSGTSYWRAHWSAQSSRVTALLDVLAECGDAITSGPNFGFSPGSAAITVDKTETLLVRLNAARQERRSVLESAFPPGLYLTMACLMASLLYCFLLRADTISGSRSATLAGFLSETPVRALFVFMTTSFYAILQILADLDDPYSGAFRVDTSVVDRARDRVRGAVALGDEPEAFEKDLAAQYYRPDMRLDDGIHLTTAGAYRAARPTIATIIEDFEIEPVDDESEGA